MTHYEQHNAAQVLNSEIGAMRNFFGAAKSALVQLLGLSADARTDGDDAHGIYEDLYYPHEGAQRS